MGDSTLHTDASTRTDCLSEQPVSGGLCAIVQATLETCFIIAGLVLAAVLLPHLTGFDGSLRYQDLVSLLVNHNLYQPNSRYSLIGPLFSTPLFLIGEQFGQPVIWICYYN